MEHDEQMPRYEDYKDFEPKEFRDEFYIAELLYWAFTPLHEATRRLEAAVERFQKLKPRRLDRG
jgi:hypothetical protein